MAVVPDKFLLVGVMSGPANRPHRQQQREWRKRFASQTAEVRMVLGSTTLNSSTRMEDLLQREQARHGDLFFVDGREGLPNVGKVTEKCA